MPPIMPPGKQGSLTLDLLFAIGCFDVETADLVTFLCGMNVSFAFFEGAEAPVRWRGS